MRYWLIFFLIWISSSVMAETMVINSFQFDNPLGAANVTKLGHEAYSAHWPGDKPYKEAATELIVVRVSPDAVEAMKEAEGGVYQATLASFMGLTGEPEEINKTLFFGSTSARKVYSSKIPRPHSANVFSKTLDDGSYVLVGVRVYQDGGSKLVQSIANTFREASE